MATSSIRTNSIQVNIIKNSNSHRYAYAGTNTGMSVGRAMQGASAEAMDRYIAPCNICIYHFPVENSSEQYFFG